MAEIEPTEPETVEPVPEAEPEPVELLTEPQPPELAAVLEPLAPASAEATIPELKAQELKPEPPKPTKKKPKRSPTEPQRERMAVQQAPGAENPIAKPSVTASNNPGASPQAHYFAKLSAWLDKHKRYPRRARQRQEQGTARLKFVIDRAGRVVSYQIVDSSGSLELDKAVEDMIQRASPLPSIPPEIQQARLEVVVPVTFTLR